MAQFASDSFTGTATTALPSYDADWVSRSGTLQISSGGDKATSNGSSHAYYTGGTPASADYSVSADIDLGALTGYGGGLTVRNATGSDTKYYARAVYDSGTGAHQLFRVVNGSFSAIAGTGSNYTPSGAKAALLQAITNGSQVDIEWWFDGTQQLTYSDTNANRIVAAGYPGISCFGGALNSNTWDNFSADDIVGSVEISPSAGAIILAGYAPIVTNSTPTGTTITPGSGSVTLTGYAPIVGGSYTVTPGAGSVTLTGYAPTVLAGDSKIITPGAGSVTLAGAAPTVTRTENQSITPDAGSVQFTGYAPVIGGSYTVTPGYGQVVITGYAPTVQEVSASPVITPDAASILLSASAPIVVNSGDRREQGAGKPSRQGKRRRIVIGDKTYDVLERDIPALLEAVLTDRKPPRTAEVVETVKPKRRKRGDDVAPVELPAMPDGPTPEDIAQRVELVQAQLQAQAQADMLRMLDRVAERISLELQDEEDAVLALLLA